MHTKRISLGFDLRVNPASHGKNPLQGKQWLLPSVGSTISADPNVWLRPEGVESLIDARTLPDFANPLHLAKALGLLFDACLKQGISTTGLSSVCLTSYEANLIALAARFGPGYFERLPDEAELLSNGWQLVGFDIVDLDGVISGLKGCGYVEPTWSQFRDLFGAFLNESGLFRDPEAASEFAEVRSLQIKEHAPFVVVGVLTKEAA